MVYNFKSMLNEKLLELNKIFNSQEIAFLFLKVTLIIMFFFNEKIFFISEECSNQSNVECAREGK